MTLWLLRPVEDWEPWYDRCFGFVVRAASEHEARELVVPEAGDEGGDVWRDPALTSCTSLPNDGEAELIIRDFAAA